MYDTVYTSICHLLHWVTQSCLFAAPWTVACQAPLFISALHPELLSEAAEGQSTCFNPYRGRWQVSVCSWRRSLLSAAHKTEFKLLGPTPNLLLWSLPLFSNLITEQQAEKSPHCSNTPNTIPLQHLCLKCVLPPIPPAWILPFFQAWFTTLSFHRNLPWPCPEKLEHLFSGHLVQAALVYVFSFCENLIPKIDF